MTSNGRENAMTSVTWENIGYGAIDEADKAEEEKYQVEIDYKLGQTYYLADSPKNKREKCRRGLLPLLMCTSFVGIIVLACSRGFDHLYPRRNRNSVTNPEKYKDLSTKRTKNSAGDSDGEHSISESLGSNACAMYPKCSALIGKCCPTDEGTELECCK